MKDLSIYLSICLFWRGAADTAAKRIDALQAGTLFIEEALDGGQLAFEELEAPAQHGLDPVEHVEAHGGVGGGVVLLAERRPLRFGLKEGVDVGEAEADDVLENCLMILRRSMSSSS